MMGATTHAKVRVKNYYDLIQILGKYTLVHILLTTEATLAISSPLEEHKSNICLFVNKKRRRKCNVKRSDKIEINLTEDDMNNSLDSATNMHRDDSGK